MVMYAIFINVESDVVMYILTVCGKFLIIQQTQLCFK